MIKLMGDDGATGRSPYSNWKDKMVTFLVKMVGWWKDCRKMRSINKNE